MRKPTYLLYVQSQRGTDWVSRQLALIISMNLFFFFVVLFLFFLHTSVLTFAAFVHTDTVIHMQQQEWFSSACLVTEEMKSKKLSITLTAWITEQRPKSAVYSLFYPPFSGFTWVLMKQIHEINDRMKSSNDPSCISTGSFMDHKSIHFFSDRANVSDFHFAQCDWQRKTAMLKSKNEWMKLVDSRSDSNTPTAYCPRRHTERDPWFETGRRRMA